MMKTTDCLNCEETVYLDYMDGDAGEWGGHGNPHEYGYVSFRFKPCTCGFVTVLEYPINWHYSLRASEEASNELITDRNKEGWSAHMTSPQQSIEKWSEEK